MDPQTGSRGRGWRTMHRVAACGGLGLLLVLSDVQPGAAQSLDGRLLDLESNAPLASGLVTLRSDDGKPVAMVFSDEDGAWRFDVPGPGAFYVEATRMDYEPWVAGPLEIGEGDHLSAVFHLRRRPVELAPIEVSVAALRRHLERSGFYERQRADFGHFMGPEEISRRRAPRLTDLLTRIPGVKLVSMTTGSVGARYVTLRGSNLSDGGICRPRVFVDGLLYAAGDSRPVRESDEVATEMAEDIMSRVDQGLSLDDIGPAEDIAALEIYRSASQVPVQFGGGSVETLCGVILVWTRRGVVRSRD